ncbi:MAG: AAA family ATPase [Candidatus Nealsonbacteria bacterium CG08_land_8_20_14_0_20_43_11]|uniref:AAA family ATPase n=1 Tax=Candidatus Nealsonbacteria bacterium CG08_land_8_20_14_0_20_43_11 TaxID=1974706 RepID=A0A2M6T1C0_9BACT|nr:MAG: AAA family ATPase [Candidatus Nealsonbacteria bacterium CG08_land_8_20_14_0_20_43_11]
MGKIRKIMKIPRNYQNLNKFLKPNKVLVIYGPRQVGKTTLLKDFLANCPLKYRLDSGDDLRIKEVFISSDFKKIKDYATGYELIVIDEAQKIPGIGQGLKILVDQVPKIKVIATGSSSFELAGQVGEPLTGRKITLTLFPVAQSEFFLLYNPYELKNQISDYLVFGCYPEVAANENTEEKKRILNELTGSYLLKDILELEKVKSSKILLDLLRLLAFQVGNEVSLSELAEQLGIDAKTVARYLDLFEKAFVLYNLRGFSRNLKKEITKKSKYYFYDNGIRNAIISNFNPLEIRNDIGQLWENFIIMERIKKQSYKKIYANNYFWRSWSKQEVDFVEERGGQLYGYEIKWKDGKVKKPSEWSENYPKAIFKIINQKNYLDFVV